MLLPEETCFRLNSCRQTVQLIDNPSQHGFDRRITRARDFWPQIVNCIREPLIHLNSAPKHKCGAQIEINSTNRVAVDFSRIASI